MMYSFETNRKNMVERQLMPMGITSADVLSVLASVPRERFVPALMQPVAYLDSVVQLGDGRYVPDSLSLARMVQAVQVKSTDVVLDIGCGTGYSSAVLAGLAGMVIGIDNHKASTQAADKLLRDLEIANAAIIYQEKLDQGYIGQGPYDVIFICGMVPAVPLELMNQLTAGGRLIAVISAKGRAGTAVLVTRSENGFKTQKLFELGLPVLKNFSAVERFTF